MDGKEMPRDRDCERDFDSLEPASFGACRFFDAGVAETAVSSLLPSTRAVSLAKQASKPSVVGEAAALLDEADDCGAAAAAACAV